MGLFSFLWRKKAKPVPLETTVKPQPYKCQKCNQCVTVFKSTSGGWMYVPHVVNDSWYCDNGYTLLPKDEQTRLDLATVILKR